MDRSHYTMQCTFKLVFFGHFFDLKFLLIFFFWQTLKAKGKTADLKKLTQVINFMLFNMQFCMILSKIITFLDYDFMH